VAAVALTLVAAPAAMKAVMRSFGPVSSWNRAMYLDGLITIGLASWSLILAAGWLGPGRARVREAARSFGTSSALASASALAFFVSAKAVDAVLIAQLRNRSGFDRWLQVVIGQNLYQFSGVAASSIIAAWSILALTGVGRRPSRWEEIASLLLGMAWLGWFVAGRWILLQDFEWLRGEVPALFFW